VPVGTLVAVAAVPSGVTGAAQDGQNRLPSGTSLLHAPQRDTNPASSFAQYIPGGEGSGSPL
jgi:hypothetical protein